MAEVVRGDILAADVEALVNTVNCVGVMGRGIALQFKKAYPANFKSYKAACDQGAVVPGAMHVHETGRLDNPRFIINFPTKRHWRANSRTADIEAGLVALVREVRERGIRSVAIPPLGCGLGGLDWQVVRPIVEQAMAQLPDVHVRLYEPAGAPASEEMAVATARPKMTQGRAALVCLVDRYLRAAMDPDVTLLEVHKLMYFMQEAGEPLRLRYAKAPYGPYAENLRHVLNAIEGHFVRGYGDAGDKPDKRIELLPDVEREARVYLADHPQTRARIERVSDLIEGFETPFGMELLATVHWVAAHDEVTDGDPFGAVRAWNPRKAIFEKNHVDVAWRTLAAKRWIGQGVERAG